MSKMEAYTCDGCGEMAPTDFIRASVMWSHGWLHVAGSGDSYDEDVDVCTWDCMATVVAARIAEGVPS